MEKGPDVVRPPEESCVLFACCELAGDLFLECIQLGLHIGAGKSVLLSGDNTLLHSVPLSHGGGIELAAAKNIQPAGEGRIGSNQSLNSGVDSGQEAFHANPANIVLRIVEEGEELADGLVAGGLIGSSVVLEGHHTVHNAHGGAGLALVGGDASGSHVDAAALIAYISGQGVGGDDHGHLAGSEHILQVVTGLGLGVGVGVAVLYQADGVLNGFHVLSGVQGPVAVGINEAAAVAPGVVGESSLTFVGGHINTPGIHFAVIVVQNGGGCYQLQEASSSYNPS